jgi:anthraniloyl-CoA monooxygenase
MNVQVLGAGPAGLYAALLLKKTHPTWDIVVTERNPRGATYGWGVVFSDRTLTGLREADFPSFTRITDSFVLWEAIDIHFRGELLRCDGHAFAGIGRRHLLTILQERCTELGVELRFETELDGADALRDGADLIIAADGANSRTRAQHPDWFEPRSSAGHARYIWFGTDKVYDAFTFIFRDTPHGLFQVHAYPFDARTSTFIVECREETWQAAGLEDADEARSLAFCQALFAEHLGPHRLMSNRSMWLTFMTLHCRRWSHDNLVILGDAAHTAHFSIGSGTKLALEDAIALANAFEATSDAAHDVRATLRQYELGRRPRVEATQRAAAESQRYFEHVGRYTHFAPRQFAFHLLTRSGRINYDNLKQRDPYFVAEVERWHEAQPRGGAQPRLFAPPPLFTPLTLRELTLPNRIVALQAPGARDAVCETAQLGAGLVLTQPVAVSLDGRITPDDATLCAQEDTERWRVAAQALQRAGSRLALQLSHAGRRGATRPRAYGLDVPLPADAGPWSLVAPSALPYGPRSQTPHALEPAELHQISADFASAAQLADGAGVDLLLLNMAHGYLLGSFLSPLTNQRDDEWGGDATRRLRFPLQVLDAVRAVWPAAKPLAVALNADDWARGGLRVSDAVAIAAALRAHGCDLLMAQAGQTTHASHPSYDVETLASYADVLRNETGLPVLATPYITTTNQANTLLAGGRCDACVMWGR